MVYLLGKCFKQYETVNFSKEKLQTIFNLKQQTHCKTYFRESKLLTIIYLFTFSCLVYVKIMLKNLKSLTCHITKKQDTADLKLEQCSYSIKSISYIQK